MSHQDNLASTAVETVAGTEIETKRQAVLTSLWKHSDFLKLWTGQTVSVFGSAVTELALPLTAVTILQATPFEMGLLATAALVPHLLFSLFAGVWVDRRSRKRPILIAADIGQALLLFTIPLSAALGILSMAQLLSVALLTGICRVFFNIAYFSYLPTLINSQYLVEGNSKLRASASLSQIGGPAVSGALVQAITAPIAIIVDALSFLVSAFFLKQIKKPEETVANNQERKIWKDIVLGLRSVMTDPVQRAIAGSAATFNFFGLVILAIFVLYATRELGLTPTLIGSVFLSGGLGGLVGALMASRVARRFGQGRTIFVSTLVFAFSLLLLPLARGPEPIVLAILLIAEFFAGFAVMLFDVNIIAMLQIRVPAEESGRTIATLSFVTQGVKALGALVGGILGQAIGLWPALWVGGLGGMTAVLWTWFSPLRANKVNVELK
jgi:MFS family permease